MRPLAWLRTAAAAVLAGVLLNAAPGPFFPVAVWYGGGTARAPMVPPMGPGAEAAWRKDLAAIKALGFNTVRTWVEWSAAEAREGEYRFDQLDLLLTLAEEAGLKVIVQVYVDSAPEWVGRKFPDGQFVTQGGIAIRLAGRAGLLLRSPWRAPGRARVLRGSRATRVGKPGILRLRPLERAGGDELGAAGVRAERAVLLLPAQHRALPRLAAHEARQPRAAEPGVVPDVCELGRGGAAAVRHHPDVRGFHGLARVHRREDRRRPEGARRRREGPSTRRIPPRATRRTRRRCSGRWPTPWTLPTTT